jgi:hypothetical protein
MSVESFEDYHLEKKALVEGSILQLVRRGRG